MSEDSSIGSGPQSPGAGDDGSGGGGAGGGGGGGDGGSTAPRREPADGVACRRRAEAAEAKAAELEARVEELTSALASAERALSEAQAEAEAVEQRRESERLLGEAHAVDLETGLMLVETLLDGGGCDCPREAVERLRQEKPFLFTPPTEPVPEPSPGVSRGLSRGSPSGMSAMGSPASSVDRFLEELEEVASHARESGDRRELLRYLRLRRGGG